MARAKLPVDEEQKSYSVVFLLAVGLLLAGAIWTIWDDNISRRPWKKYQTEFYMLEVDKAKQAIDSFFKVAGDVLSGVLVFVGGVLAFAPRHFAMVNLALAAGWLGVALWVGRRYRALVTGTPG